MPAATGRLGDPEYLPDVQPIDRDYRHGVRPIDRESRHSARPIGPESSGAQLARLDQRTREARLVKQTRAELVRHVGGKPSITQFALIERLVQLTLRLALMDRKFAKTQELTEHDSRTYLAWSNSYTRLMRQLGLQSVEPLAPTLGEFLADRTRSETPESAASDRTEQRSDAAHGQKIGPSVGVGGHGST